MRFDEGLGTVYERFMLNDFFDTLLDTFRIDNVLEVPMYGMTGLHGINSAHLVERGCALTVVDTNKDRVQEARELWAMFPFGSEKCTVMEAPDLSRLPFSDGSFDLVWDFAALWHADKVERLLPEMARLSTGLVLIFVPNMRQPGYLLRKHLFSRDYFLTVDERWNDLERVASILTGLGMKEKNRGVLDIPPWPDTCVSLKSILGELSPKRAGEEKEESRRWVWDIVSYYRGHQTAVKEKVERLAFIEKSSLPEWMKGVWAHHRYALFSWN